MNGAILPVPFDAKPILGVSLLQLYVEPATVLTKFTDAVGELSQTT